MDFTTQTVCMFEPTYLRLLVLAVLFVGVCAFTFMVVGVRRGFRDRQNALSRVRGIHSFFAAILLAHAVGSLSYYGYNLRELEEYERAHRQKATFIHEALGSQARSH